MIKRMSVFFSGTVQGVGFRFTAQRIARGFDVTGYVRNLPDGRVELEAEGEEPFLHDLLSDVRDGEMASYIRDTEVNWSPARGAFSSFSIRM